MVSFTKESWHGKMRACRGAGASLSDEEMVKWDVEHGELFERIASEQFDVLHYAALKEKGYKKASLAVQKANYAVRMYEKVGFKTVGENAEEYIMVCGL